MRTAFALLLMCLLGSCATRAPVLLCDDEREPQAVTQGITGTLLRYPQFPSTLVAARTVDVWLPPSYKLSDGKRYPVIYMHDGQMLWDASVAWNRKSWDADGVMADLIAKGQVREAIIVGIHNTPKRFEEYMPAKAVGDAGVQGLPDMPVVSKADVLSDQYLKFLVDELKPFIDSRYRTAPGPENTFMLGSSMGGLISLYAISEYPQVFGGVAALSTHWPAGNGSMISYLQRALPDAASHRIYMDHGTATLDAAYAPYQQQMDKVMRKRGYLSGSAWQTHVFPGAAHDEDAWNARLAVPLRFLLGQ